MPEGAEHPVGNRRPVSNAITPLILPLEEVGREDLALVGGKAANLGELLRAGFPVPAGFVVTTAAYDRLVAHAGLEVTISRMLDPRPEDGAAVREALARAPMPPELEREIRTAYRRLGRGPVVVRSSATAEDLPGAAFAGQQDTFLNLVDPEAVLAAVRRCFASLWTDRAVAYRERRGFDPRGLRLAVVVQRLVEARTAGVLFTANPVTGAREEVVIEAVPGLGEALVSGLVTPDRLLLRRRPWGRWRVVARTPGRWEVLIRPREGGGTEPVPLDTAGRGGFRLSDREARRLARLGRAIERHFGSPQDVEWARADGRSLILQARPMTALPEPPPRAGRMGRTLAALTAEIVPVRPYPLDATSWFPALLTEALAFASHLTGVVPPSVETLFVVDDDIVVRFRGGVPLRPTPALLLAPWRLLMAGRRLPTADWRQDPDLQWARARIRTLERRDPSALSWRELLDTAREALALLRPLAREPRLRHLPAGISGLVRLRLLLALAGGGRRLGDLLSGVETMTAETNRRLEALAARIRSDPELAALFSAHEASELWSVLERRPSGRAFLGEFQTFLDEYGHREAAVSLVSMPTWRDAPETVLGLLQGLAGAVPAAGEGPPAWELARDQLLFHPLLGKPPLRGAFLASLERARRLVQVREDTHFFATMPMPVLRRTFLELGRRLVAAGALDAPEEVFHLARSDLEGVEGAWPPPASLVSHLRSLARRRRERRAALEGVPLVDPRPFRRPGEGADVLLRGTPGSPGLAEGPVRVVRDPSQWGRLRDGEVLVAPYTNPSWTPLFRRAAAVVADTGSVGSHAAIVAREYGIPAVMATVEGTRRLVDGERVRVDGTRGLVLRAATAPTSGAPGPRR